ncbi:MAG: hypothetical protein H6863_04265 [Rhodospirillales bacterium]|nr:hypothetical protein [Rhodospirillales bacterium]
MLTPGTGFAEETAANALKPVAGEKIRALEDYTAELLNGLEPAQAEYIFQIRMQYGIIHGVQTVRRDIGSAVKSCGDKNPEMAEEMTQGFRVWNEMVTPRLDKADAALKTAIQRQGFRPTVRLNMLLDHIQAAFQERDSQFEKIPVTTAEACRGLLDSLSETDDELNASLEETVQTLTTLSAEPVESVVSEEKK